MKSKEDLMLDILAKHKIVRYQGLFQETMSDAMDEYAKQEAIAFAEWTLLAECEYSCTDEDQWTHQDILENGIAQNITTEQLYNLYLESKKQKV